jgi:hypothetical protein
MAASIHGVRDSVDGILADLQRSDEGARAAAAVAGEEARLRVTEEPVDELVEVTPGEAAPAQEMAIDVAPAEPAEDPPTEETPIPVPALDVAEAGALDEMPVGDAPSVDELFARIRAGTDVPAEGAATAPGPVPEAVTEAMTEAVPEPEEASDDPDQALIARRAELLTPFTSQLSRHIKRALGDDQNRLLDVLRSAPATHGEALLGPEDVQVATFTAAAHGHLADAFGAGVTFAGGKVGKAPTEAAAEQAAAGLARMVVTMLRRRIEDGTDAGEDVAARVGAAFREWRGERIERLAGDGALQAFSAGVLAAVPKKGTVRWVLTSADGCSDCDDNALAGAVPVAEGFPTGHAGPPAHAGCRCLVTPMPT